MIKFKQSGDFKNTEKLFANASKINYMDTLHRYGKEGVAALAMATPKDSGNTANCWGYEIIQNGNGFGIKWANSNIVNGVPIAIILQYGHGTRNGGYVQGRDYINPTIKPIFDKIADGVWKEVTRL